LNFFINFRILPVCFLGPVNNSSTQNDSNMDLNLSSSNNKSNQIHSLTQLIVSLDMEQWESLVQVFHIQKSMINNEN
jgi:hypothetical protein